MPRTFAGDVVLSVSEWFIVIAEFTTDFFTEPGVIFGYVQFIKDSSFMSFYWVLSCEQLSESFSESNTSYEQCSQWITSWISLSDHLLNWINQACVSQKHCTPQNRSVLQALSEECDVLAVIAQYLCIYCISKLNVRCCTCESLAERV